MKIRSTLIVLFIITSGRLTAQDKIDTIVRLFEPGLISTPYPNRDIAIAPDGKEIFYTIQSYKREFSVIMHLIKDGDAWKEPQVASFSGTYNDLEPAFSPDGRQLYFASNRPTADKPDKKDHDIWVMDKKDHGWATPVNLGGVINTEKDEYYPSVTHDGSIFFTAEYEGNKGKEDIYVSRRTNGQYMQPESLDTAINSETYEFNAYVAPDESYIIFSSYGRTDDLGGSDLYMSQKNDAGQWQPARHLPAPINSPYLDYCPFVSPDGKYFFFTSNRSAVKKENQSYENIKGQLENIQNGFDNVYRVDFKFLLHH